MVCTKSALIDLNIEEESKIKTINCSMNNIKYNII